MAWRARMLPVVVAATAAACVTPTDRSDTLRIELDQIPELFEGDSLHPVAMLVDADGNAVPNGEVRLATANPLVVAVDTSGFLVAVDSGMTTLTATAVRFAETPAVARTVRVHARIEIDSVRPVDVRFGDTLRIFGAGLNPDKLFVVTLGETSLNVAGFTPADPAAPDRFGVLSLWVAPPARTSGGLVVLSALGGVVFPQDVRVSQVDIYEPNDSVPSSLGTLSDLFLNPALAFEARGRGDTRVPADWYRFTTTAPGDWTIEIGTTNVGRRVAVFVADTARWDGVAWDFGLGLYEIADDRWMVGTSVNVCQGRLLYFAFGADTAFISPLQFQGSGGIVALRNLPAGTYDVGAVYLGDGFTVWDRTGQRTTLAAAVNRDSVAQAFALPSTVRISPSYRSVLAPDAYEENDYCDLAAPITVPGSQSGLTIDNPHDVDWYRFTVSAPLGQALQFTVTAEDAAADLDIWVVRDVLPDSLVIEDLAFGPGRTDATSGRLLPAGDYFLIVTDFIGVPTSYTLSGAGVLPSPPAAVPPASAASAAKLELLRRAVERRRIPER